MTQEQRETTIKLLEYHASDALIAKGFIKDQGDGERERRLEDEYKAYTLAAELIRNYDECKASSEAISFAEFLLKDFRPDFLDELGEMGWMNCRPPFRQCSTMGAYNLFKSQQ